MPECQECGMVVAAGEYHPYAACLMFKACHDGDKVRESLRAVLNDARRTAPDREAVIEECAKVCDLLANVSDVGAYKGAYWHAGQRVRALKSAPTAARLAALDRLAENAHELGLGYEPLTKAEPYQWRDTGPLETGDPK
jgi:hypothetical protein